MKVNGKIISWVIGGILFFIPQLTIITNASEVEGGNNFLSSQKEVANGTVEVQFVDEAGNEIAPSENLVGPIGNEYTYYPQNLDDYIIVRFEGDLSGEFTEENQVVQIVYAKVVQSAEIYVTYLDQLGNEIAPSEKVTGLIGENYIIEAKTISGYNLIDTFGMPQGQFDQFDRGVAFIYSKQAATTVVPEIEETILNTSTSNEQDVNPVQENNLKNIEQNTTEDELDNNDPVYSIDAQELSKQSSSNESDLKTDNIDEVATDEIENINPSIVESEEDENLSIKSEVISEPNKSQVSTSGHTETNNDSTIKTNEIDLQDEVDSQNEEITLASSSDETTNYKLQNLTTNDEDQIGNQSNLQLLNAIGEDEESMSNNEDSNKPSTWEKILGIGLLIAGIGVIFVISNKKNIKKG